MIEAITNQTSIDCSSCGDRIAVQRGDLIQRDPGECDIVLRLSYVHGYPRKPITGSTVTPVRASSDSMINLANHDLL